MSYLWKCSCGENGKSSLKYKYCPLCGRVLSNDKIDVIAFERLVESTYKACELIEKALRKHLKKDDNDPYYLFEKISLFTPRDNKNLGDLRHHRGINIKSKNGNSYFVSIAGLNLDRGSKNVHSSFGRIQLYMNDGTPNEKYKLEEKIVYDIKYPDGSETTAKDIYYDEDNKIDKSKEVVFTGYKIYQPGIEKCGDVLFSGNEEEFADVIKCYIKKYEESFDI